jgi:hypothetical protein
MKNEDLFKEYSPLVINFKQFYNKEFNLQHVICEAYVFDGFDVRYIGTFDDVILN